MNPSQLKTTKTVRTILAIAFVIIVFYLIYRAIRWFETKGLAIYADTYPTDKSHQLLTRDPVTNKHGGCQ